MDTNLIIDALQRCADMDSATARGYRIDAENCEQSHSEVIQDRAELLRFRAEKLDEKAAEYRRVISAQNLRPLEMLEIKVATCQEIIDYLEAWFDGATLDPIRLKGMVATVQSESSQNTMHHTITTNLTDPPTLTLTAHRQQRWTPGWITHNLIVFPRVCTAADAAGPAVADMSHLVSLFLATADRLADLAVQITRLERQAKSGRISPRAAAGRLRRILATVESSMETLDQTPL